MLAAQPDIAPGGERSELIELSEDRIKAHGGLREFGRQVNGTAPSKWAGAASALLDSVAAWAGDASRAADKMPHNFEYLGALSRLLPGARVVHCMRSPFDTCVSIFMQSFTAAHAYRLRQDCLAHHYQQYGRLMAHWRTLPGLRLFEIQ